MRFLPALLAVATLAWAGAPDAQQAPAQPQPSAPPRAAAGTGTAKPYPPPRTPWGDPDLQGIYTNKDENNTPFERPADMAGKTIADFGPAEMAALTRQRQEMAKKQAASIGGRRRRIRVPDRRTGTSTSTPYNAQPWLVIEPEDGRVPPRRRRRVHARPRGWPRERAVGRPTAYTDRSLYDRCISRGVPDICARSSTASSYDITQAPGYVVIRHEMIHDARVIQLDGRPRLSPAIRQYMGDSRGWWDGATLVVETTNIHDAMELPRGIVRAEGHRALHTRGRRPISWTARMEDPTTWERPWAIRMPLKRDDTQTIFEYACHEGNRGLENIMRAARATEGRKIKRVRGARCEVRGARCEVRTNRLAGRRVYRATA